MTELMPILPQVGAFLKAPKKLLIDGNWSVGTGGELPVINPADGKALCVLSLASIGDVDAAVGAARASFAAQTWRTLPPSQRARILWNVGDLIEKYGDELAQLETLDNGKAFGIARHVDVAIAADTFRYHAGWVTKITGTSLPLSFPGQPHAVIHREAVGVVGLIIPWNFPLGMAAFKLAPALAAGCSCVLKPAEQTSLTALRLGEILIEAGVPAGVVNIVPGTGQVAGAALATHKGVDKISFTGSTATGQSILLASAGNLKRLSLELGGKSPVVILKDADVQAATMGAAMAIFFNSGQVCTAGSRVLVHRSIHDQVVEGLAYGANAMVVGNGLAMTSQMGPLVSGIQRDRVSAHVVQAKSSGASVICGGVASDGDGYFYPPTVITHATHAMEIMQEEVFGPVVAVQAFDETDEAIALANDSKYALSASVWTQELAAADHVSRAINAGTVWINGHNIVDPALPYGGRKMSGYGYENGQRGLDQFLQDKAIVTATA